MSSVLFCCARTTLVYVRIIFVLLLAGYSSVEPPRFMSYYRNFTAYPSNRIRYLFIIRLVLFIVYHNVIHSHIRIQM